MTELQEYARVFTQLDTLTGIQARITLPAQPPAAPSPYDYVNFFVGLHSLAEAGISYSRRGDGSYQWRFFLNCYGQGEQYTIITPSSVVYLKLLNLGGGNVAFYTGEAQPRFTGRATGLGDSSPVKQFVGGGAPGGHFDLSHGPVTFSDVLVRAGGNWVNWAQNLAALGTVPTITPAYAPTVAGLVPLSASLTKQPDPSVPPALPQEK